MNDWEERSVKPYYDVGGPESERSYGSLKQELLRRGKLFEDPDFPANARSLYYKSELSPEIMWRRPGQIVNNPVFVNKKATRFDLDQGQLGDCWFIAAAASLAATNMKLLERVVPFDQSFSNDYAGIFRFKFWHYDRWIEVVVDDRLPTYRGRSLVYASNREERNEFWPALLEKAYAKLKGSYQALDGGQIQEALVDMTSGISETISFKKDKVYPGEFFEMLKKMYQMNSLFGFPIYKKQRSSTREVEMENGLFEGHAYSLTSLVTIKFQDKDEKLLRLRNPWGRREWRGDWSDKSSKWNALSEAQRKELGVTIANDGEFWIPVEDVIENFDEVNITHMTPDSFSTELSKNSKKREWEVQTIRDSWVKGVSAGGCGNSPYASLYWKNPQFKLNIDSDLHLGTVVVSLTEVETDARSSNSIGCDIYQLRPGAKELLDENYSRSALLLKARTTMYSPNREYTVRHEFSPGKYIVIPSTFKPFVEADFVLRIFSEMKVSSRPIDKPTSPITPDPEEDDVITKLFRTKTGISGNIDALELRDILSEARRIEWNDNDGFTLECCRSLISSFDWKKKTGLIGLYETKKIWTNLNLWKNAFKSFDKDNNGMVDTYELNEIYNAIGLSVGRGVLTSIVKRYGGRQSKIGYEDLVLSSTRLLHMYGAFKRYSNSGKDAVLDSDEWLQETIYN